MREIAASPRHGMIERFQTWSRREGNKPGDRADIANAAELVGRIMDADPSVVMVCLSRLRDECGPYWAVDVDGKVTLGDTAEDALLRALALRRL